MCAETADLLQWKILMREPKERRHPARRSGAVVWLRVALLENEAC